ncbi:MAG: hypothetical protein PHP53_21545 [Prolixibacteraceae bacterium]|nr:hypothetical protein [Prolixibacteraceae bacterium]
MTEMNGKINSNERFVRWQTVLRDQLSFLNSLLLTISIGILGFLLSLLKTPDFMPVCMEKFFFTAGLLSISMSILLGIATAYTRLMDYRKTVKKIGTELKRGAGLSQLKKLMKLYEKLSWCIFHLQIISFGLSILFLLTAFCVFYSEKLF